MNKKFPWGRFYELGNPVRLDVLSAVLDVVHECDDVRIKQLRRGKVDDFVGESEDTAAIRGLIERVAPSATTVLVVGESGTGKEVIARQIHRLSGRKGPFVPINCGAIPEQLLESEFFGHERGAFTGAARTRVGRFELANRGTLFLDEIGDMDMMMQVKLLRVLQERSIERVGGNTPIPVDIRIIAATHRDLPRHIEEGKFREDLFYRLCVFPIEVSPLRDRIDDIEPLIRAMTDRVRREYAVDIALSPEALKLLTSYSWPGNVRELSNLIERLAVTKPNGLIESSDLPWPINAVRGARSDTSATSTPVPETSSNLPPGGLDLKAHLAGIERRMIKAALAESDGVVKQAAGLLGMGRTTLVEKIRRYDLRQQQDAR